MTINDTSSSSRKQPSKVTEAVVFGTAVMFMTRLPVGQYASGDQQVLARSVRYFPIVGLIVAVIMSAALYVAHLVLPLSVAIVITLVVGVMATGALHEDGLADVADSAGAFDISRKLDIMRDSRVGTYGSLGLILCIVLRFTLIWELCMAGGLILASVSLVLAHASSRWSSAYLMRYESYARPEAANRVVAQGVDDSTLLLATISLLIVLAIPAIVITPWAYVCVAFVWLATVACARYFRSTFHGITGDCLGAANVVIELACLALVLTSFRY